MRWLIQMRMKVRMLLRRGGAAAHLDDELSFHLEQQIGENLAAGMSAEQARRAALRSFGNPGLVREEARATWSWNWLDSLLRDIRIGLRTLGRSPGFTSIAMLVMALGIGANVAMFTVVRSVLLKPLPFREPERLMRLYEQSADGRFAFNRTAGGVFAAWQRQSRSFTDLALSNYAGYNLSGAAQSLPEAVRAAEFSSNLLTTLGVQPALGRNFSPEDDRPQANATVLLSWGLWKRRYGGDAGILSQTILLDTKPYTVIGIMPAWFAYPDQRVQLWTPLYHQEAASVMQALDDHEFTVVGRLKSGATAAKSVAELSVICAALHNQHSDNPMISKEAEIRPLLDSMVGDMRRPLYILLAATGCVLLIACLNVANLLVARSSARRREIAIRTALGGRRMDLLRQHLMESFLLSAGGGAAGVLLASGVLRWIVHVRQDISRVESIHLDGEAVLFCLGLVVLCALLAGLVSSYTVRSDQVLGSLQQSSRLHSAGQGRTRLRSGLLMIEVGLTVVLLIGAGLLMKSYARLRASELGCLTQNVLTMNFNLPEARYSQRACAAFFQSLLGRVRSYPGLKAAGLVFPVVPGDGYGGDNGFSIVGQPPLPVGRGQTAIHRWADPGYFAAIGIPILRGRTFNADPRAPMAEVMVTRTFAQQYFPGDDPVGHQLLTLGQRPYTIVGVVGDTRFGIGDPVQPMMYFSIFRADWLDLTDYINGASLVVRSDEDVSQLAIPMQRIFAQLDRDLPVSEILTMDQIAGRNTVDASFNATLLLVFSGLSVVLAAVGLFGVLSYIVAQRTSELGIRIALGAQRQEVLRLVLLDGLRPAIVGLALGLGASAGAAQLIRSMLYGTQPLDPAIFAAVSVTLPIVAAVACLAPAWRASRLDPMQALRAE